MAVLDELTSIYLGIAIIRSDNDPEFIVTLRPIAARIAAHQSLISSQLLRGRKGFAESFNSGSRDEFLITEMFATVAEAEGLATTPAVIAISSGHIRLSMCVSLG